MKILVIYDSVFGNTEKIAQSVAGGLAERGEVKLMSIKDATPQKLADAGLVVVGSPTRGFRPTKGMHTGSMKCTFSGAVISF